MYLLDADSGGTFMSKYKDEALELIELVAENNHHHAARSFKGRNAPAKEGCWMRKRQRQVCF